MTVWFCANNEKHTSAMNTLQLRKEGQTTTRRPEFELTVMNEEETVGKIWVDVQDDNTTAIIRYLMFKGYKRTNIETDALFQVAEWVEQKLGLEVNCKREKTAEDTIFNILELMDLDAQAKNEIIDRMNANAAAFQKLIADRKEKLER